jgi:hypothetical protein
MPKTSASLAFWTVAYRRINILFVRAEASLLSRIRGLYEITCKKKVRRLSMLQASGKEFTSHDEWVMRRFARKRLSSSPM